MGPKNTSAVLQEYVVRQDFACYSYATTPRIATRKEHKNPSHESWSVVHCRCFVMFRGGGRIMPDVTKT
jgi:hypothetical protein